MTLRTHVVDFAPAQQAAVRRINAVLARAPRLRTDAWRIDAGQRLSLWLDAAAGAITVPRLRKRGVTGWQELILKSPATQSLSNGAYKTKARAGIEARGWRIAFTVGDQLSDLTGGHAAQRFLLPNPMYYVG